MNAIAALCAELQDTWRKEIPLAAAMAIEVAGFDGQELVVRAPLAPNRNLHGTAFAGSLFSVCVLTGWGKVWLALHQRGLAGRIVVADSRIEYRKGVTGEILCRCNADPQVERATLDALAASGRGEFPLTCTVDGAAAPAVHFEARYVVVAKR